MSVGRRRRPATGRRPATSRGGRDLSPAQAHRRGRAARKRGTSPAPRPRRSITLPALQLRPVGRVAILAAEVVLLFLLVSRPGFAASRIEVSGIKHLTRQQVLDRAGLTAGTSIFLISTSDAESLLAGDPYIRSVTVRAALPDEVRVEVTEWEALAVVTRGNAHYLVNQDGGVLGLAPGVAVGGPDQPHFAVTQESTGQLQPGQSAINSRLLTDLDRMASTFPSAYHLTVKDFVIQAGGQLIVETDAVPRILFGQMVTDEQLDSLDPKLAALKSLAAQVDLAHANLLYINDENPTALATQAQPSPSPSVRPTPSKKP